MRLPWSNELVGKNPVISNKTVILANLDLLGLSAMSIFDKVVEELSRQELLIVLDNHMSDADWCCNENDGNGLWYNARYPESKWIEDWEKMAQRYRQNAFVVAADLRNELRKSCGPFLGADGQLIDECRTPKWGSGSAEVDWYHQ